MQSGPEMDIQEQQSLALNEQASLVEQIRQLKQENQELKTQLANLEQGHCPTYEEILKNNKSQTTGAECEWLNKEKYIAAEEVHSIVQASLETAEYANWLGTNFKNDPDFDYVQALKETFDDEPADNSPQAREFEKDLSDIFNSVQGLADFPFHQVVCKQKNCYVELGVYSANDVNIVPFQLQQQLESKDRSFDISTIRSAFSPDSGTLGLYLVKRSKG